MRHTRPYKHKCAAFGCKTLVPFRHLMCDPHWMLVPRDVQTAVYAAWNSGVKSPAWTAAVAAALEAVTPQQELFA